MPKRKARCDYVKLYRPRGGRYATGRTAFSYQEAIDSAFMAWEKEFHEDLRKDQTVIEVIGVTGGYSATIWEIVE